MNNLLYNFNIKKDNEYFNWYYDISTNKFYNSSKDPINLIYKIDNKNIPADFKDKRSFHICISMGMKCNYSCDYCSESCNKTYIDSSWKNHKTYIKTLKKFIDNKFGNIDKFEISFWGGEPLLYFEDIRKLVDNIYEEFEGKILDFGLSTNGSLLNTEKTEYFLKNNFTVQISHDGPGQFVRNKNDIFATHTEQYYCVLQGLASGRLWKINPVFHKYNNSLQRYLDYFNDKFGFIPYIGETLCLKVHDENSLKYVLTKDQLESLANEKIDNINSENSILNRMTNQFLDKFYNKYGITYWFGSCLPTKCNHYVTIDSEGTVWTCHNTSGYEIDIDTGENYRRGSIFTNELCNPKYLKIASRWNTDCKECLMKYICVGGCPIRPSKYQHLNCQSMWYHSLPAWYAIIKRMTDGGQLISINKTDKKLYNNTVVPNYAHGVFRPCTHS